jgi:hypothetical protein
VSASFLESFAFFREDSRNRILKFSFAAHIHPRDARHASSELRSLSTNTLFGLLGFGAYLVFVDCGLGFPAFWSGLSQRHLNFTAEFGTRQLNPGMEKT